MRILVSLLVFVLSGCGATPIPPSEPINLVIVSIDTLRADHLGVYGYPHPTSPNLDRFAQRSIVFEQAVTVHVATAPAHGTILTGRYPGSHGIQRNGMRLSPDVPTLAETLAGCGFSTGAFVSSWTMERHTGLDRGFAMYDDELDGPGAGARRAGDLTTKAALSWLQAQVSAEREFFLFLHLFEPHWPYDPPAKDALRFLRGQYELTTISKPTHIDRLTSTNPLSFLEQREYTARYDGEIVVADRLFEILLDSLQELGVAHNTVVMVLSDHGETLFEREWTMDHGTRPYEEQARVPILLHIPGDPSAGHRVAEQVSLLDVVPTLLDVFELDLPNGVQGRSLLPIVRGDSTPTTPRPAFITARSVPERVPHIDAPLTSHGLVRAIRLPDIKLIEYPTSENGRYPELFELTDDPDEKADRAATKTDITLVLHQALERWQTESGTNPDPEGPTLSPEVEAALRELGYLDD